MAQEAGRDLDVNVSTACQHCNALLQGRNLVLSFDGTSNQFGKNVFFLAALSRCLK